MSQTCRYLADMGHDVTLYLIDEYAHFHPSSDSYNAVNFKLKEFPLAKTDIVKISRKKLIAEFGQYDYLMGIEYGPAIALRIGKPLNVFYSAATDLSDYPFSNYSYGSGSTWKTEDKYLADLQFYGIKYAKNLSMNMAPLPIENALVKIGFEGNRFEALPYLYMNLWLKSDVLQQSILKATFDSVRNRFDILLFHHIRHEWGDDTAEVHQKGNHKLIHALHALKNNSAGKSVGLITFDYGNSVNKTKQLIESLGLQDNVVWFQVSKRKDYMYGISIADICVGQLHHNMITYTSFAEYVALKKPVVQWFSAPDSERHHLPFFAVASQDELIAKLQHISSNLHSETIIQKAEQSYKWLDAENVQKPLNAIRNDMKMPVSKKMMWSTLFEWRFQMSLLIDKLKFRLKISR